MSNQGKLAGSEARNILAAIVSIFVEAVETLLIISGRTVEKVLILLPSDLADHVAFWVETHIPGDNNLVVIMGLPFVGTGTLIGIAIGLNPFLGLAISICWAGLVIGATDTWADLVECEEIDDE
jgi:hypothetical protein